MNRIPVINLGTRGVINDRPAQYLPPEAWTLARNMRMREDGAVRFAGEVDVFNTPSVAPIWAIAVPGVGAYYWLYSDGPKMYVWNGTTHTDITKLATSYGTTDEDLWTGTLLGGVPILNNGVDAPQYWSALDTSVKLVDLLNWPANTTCKSLRAFGPYLLALNVTKSGTSYPNMVKWSHPADPGAVPVSWDHTDPIRDAGEAELTDVAAGGLLDGVPLGNIFCVYKENSTHTLRFLNNRFVFDFDPLFEGIGALSINCAAPVPGLGKIFLATGDDIVIHGAQRGELESLLDGRARRFINSSVDGTNKGRSFVVANERQKEMWFCYPEQGGTWPTVALVWNYVFNTLTFRDLAECSYIATGIVQALEAISWNSDTDSWVNDMETWNEPEIGAQEQSLLGCLPNVTRLVKLDVGTTFRGSLIPAFLERGDLAISGMDRQGQPIVDLARIKLIQRIWIRATGSPFSVRVGGQEEQGAATYWSSTETFTPGEDKYVDFEEPISGRYITVRFESVSDMGFTLEGYDLGVALLGEF